MHKVLQDIVKKKRADLTAAKSTVPIAELRRQAQSAAYESGFRAGLLSAEGTALIAEIKLASPTHPKLGDPDAILARAASYEAAGANAISYITESHYFRGSLADIARLKQATSLPVLQKDFVIDPYQIYQARLAGSDALLLIARLLGESELRGLVGLAQELGVEPVVEINDEADLAKALSSGTQVIAVNARDLSTFTIDVPAACGLLRQVPDNFTKLGFSGVTSSKQVDAYASAGAQAVLVGTSLMQADDIALHIAALRGRRT